ncbi:MAG: folate-binding protein, partial [Pseudolabrys sp.]
NDGGGFFLDCPRALASALVEKLNFYKLRAKVICEDLSNVLGVMAIWDGTAESEYGLSYPDPRLPALGSRIMLPPHLAEEAAADLGGMLAGADAYEAHRIALGVPRGGLDFIYGDTFSHEADMDQLNGVDFGKGCYIGQEVVSRVEHRASARSRVVPIVYDEFAPSSGLPVMAGDRQIGTLGSTAKGHGLALMRLDRIGDALAAGATIEAGGIAIRAVKPAWAKFDWPGEAKAPA